jgi:hydroxymethylglutaryl-CoA reductase
LLKAEAARQRAMVAQARLERIDNAKSALQGAMVGAVGFVTHNVNVVANEAVLAVVESAEAVERAYRRAASMVETNARAGLVYASRSWRSLKS